jgi:peptide/nickel transport system substrate-binding protein
MKAGIIMKNLLCMLMSVLVLILIPSPMANSMPLVNELYMVILRDPDAQIIAIENSRIDVLGDLLRPIDIERLSKSPNVELSIAPAFHSFYLSFNTRKFPFNSKILRQAIWQVIPKEKIVRDLFSGYAAPIDSYLPPVSTWLDKSVKYLSYDPDAARALLKEHGWSWDTNGILVSPNGETLKPMKLLSPTASVAPTSAEIGNQATEAMRKLGIPIESEPMDFSAMLARLDRHDFDAVVHAWTLSRDPDSLFAFYHSSMDVQAGYNISGMSDPKLDEVLLALRDAPDEKSARVAVNEAQALLADIIPSVPIYSRYWITAIQKGWDGIYTSERTTADNFWTLTGMFPSDGKMRPVYWTLSDEPRSLNPITASSAYDWMVMSNVYDTLLSIHPDTFEDIPWLATEWSVKNEDNKTVIEFKLRDDVKWHDGKTLSVEDIINTFEYMKKIEAPRYYDSVKDIESITSQDTNTVVVKFSKTSYWNLHNIGGLPILPKHILECVEDWKVWQPAREKHPDNPQLTQLIGTGPFVFSEYRVGDFVHFKRNENFWKPSKDER